MWAFETSTKVLITSIITLVIGLGALIPSAIVTSNSISDDKSFRWGICTTLNITDACNVYPQKGVSYDHCQITVRIDYNVTGVLVGRGLQADKDYYLALDHPVNSSYNCLYNDKHTALVQLPPITPAILGVVSGATLVLGSIVFIPFLSWINSLYFTSFDVQEHRSRPTTNLVLFFTFDMAIGKASLVASICFIYFNSWGLIFFTYIATGFAMPSYASNIFFSMNNDRRRIVTDEEYYTNIRRGISMMIYGILLVICYGISSIVIAITLISSDTWTSPIVYICLLAFGLFSIYSRIIYLIWIHEYLTQSQRPVHSKSCQLFGTFWILLPLSLYQMFAMPLFLLETSDGGAQAYGFLVIIGGAGTGLTWIFHGYPMFTKIFPYIVNLNIVSIVARFALVMYYKYLSSGYILISLSFLFCDVVAVIVAIIANRRHRNPYGELN